MRQTLKLMTLILVAVLSTLSTECRAEDAPKKTEPSSTAIKIRPRFWYHLAALPVYALLADNLHEGSHALTALAMGKKITRYEPYPHFVDMGDGKRHFVFGLMEAEGAFSKGEEVAMLIAPSVTDLTMFLAADLTLSLTNPDAWYAPVLWFAGMVWPMIDWLTGMNGMSQYSDVSRVSSQVGLNRVGVAIVGDAIAAVALWRVLHHGKRIFLTGWPTSARVDVRDEKNGPTAVLDSLTVTPALGSAFTGLAVSARF